MSRLFMFEKPLGMRDTLPDLYERKAAVRTSIQEEMKRWGYQFIETPALEYYETVGAASAILDQQLFKLLDQQGHTLVLRPDMTAPIARVAASRLLKDELPIRLAYSANVYRAQQREGGRPAEFEQIGVECIGDHTISADGEGMALMISALKEAGLRNFQLSAGHIGFVRDFFQQILGTEERVENLTRFLYEKNYVGYREHVKSLALSSIDKQRLLDFLKLRGGEEVIEIAYGLLENGTGKKALAELEQLWSIMRDYGQEGTVKFDLTLVSHMSYYTGILFEVYAGNVGFPIGNGGRYDLLLQKFGKDTGATGFAIRLDRLLEALEDSNEAEPVYCILYSPERRKEAFDFAKEERSAGKKVVLQDISGVKDIDACTSQYEDITFLVGKAGKESIK
ncbi:ATP phosphoribosyltransferase regulatory subunit [Cytobacillus firmus]|uniref:ATP phosphoribosyltransferase regulatory subunit n=1 Tax=Cytobacillus firmus TaxID=1399 RepID=A0AA46P6U0_CYTFI|nr:MULTISPECIES: ATP phosphoribosyltransferase regulatory subunit [Bacillaceae]MBG9444545.1 ATP phosphoribosyltransferase [Cytobacillus firmus]MBY6052258.1 ATP phosphoribosyltransferase regulatory subunit [Cytobacillus firmus]MCC3648654.1 ATP phosphoribosyltransferase regulatory subunit [Cytobacillus oceanisediminis]MCU1806965.1 ATP phosphoribosyltransferase regulatory subunit [Cytobacillus firmus]USK38522.1 ATP phosphoribosyltransferase regulatory subunit [Cytobacillus firmus]